MKISIITINYNNRAGLERTITSVLEQSCRDLEYLVIDGGSSDGSAELIEKYKERFTYSVSEKDNGIYDAMNKGIKKAAGEYCLFLNSGDRLAGKDILNSVISELSGDPVIYGNGRREEGNGTTVEVDIPGKLTLDFFSSNSLFHPASFIRRELFERFGYYNESNKIVSDWEFFLKTIIVNDVKARKIPFEIAIIEDGGISRNEASRQLLEREIAEVLSRYFSPRVIEMISEQKQLRKGGPADTAKNEQLLRIERSPVARRIVGAVMKICLFFLPRVKK
jgi:glycosyltransferase involved in cell wall biosynthesis